MKKTTLLTLCLLLIIAVPAFALNVTATWDSVDKATGYKLYFGQASRAYGVPVDSAGAITVTVPITQEQDDKTWYFAVTAYNQYGESPYSVEVAALIPGLHEVPTSPTLKRIDINLEDRTITIFNANGTTAVLNY